VSRAYAVQAEILAVAEGAVLTVRHADGSMYHDTVRVGPELTRLDLVSKAKFLVTRILDGRLSAAAAYGELTGLQSSREPYPWWLRFIGVTLFAIGFAPGVQQTWRDVRAAAFLGAVMGLMFIAAEWVSGLLRPDGRRGRAQGLTALAGNPRAQGFNDIRDATSETLALTLGLIAGAVPAAVIGYFL